jgi:hypothetical protein
MIEYKDDWIAKKTKKVGLGGVVTGVLLGTTGDDEADAALDAYTAINSIVEGDKVVSKAQENWDAGGHTEAFSELEKARKQRPNDWSYMHKEMAWKFADGDEADALEMSYSALEAAGSQGTNPLAIYNDAIDELQAVLPQVQQGSGPAKKAYYRQLSTYYLARANEHDALGQTQQADLDRQLGSELAAKGHE